MKSIYTVLLLLILIISQGCYSGINGKVVDSITGKELEAALVFVQWRKPVYRSIEGISSEVILDTESLTDKNGEFSISKTPFNPFAYPPVMLIYKEGYIPWRNDSIFPISNRVKENEWNNNAIYKLNKLDSNYTFSEVEWFINSGIKFDYNNMPSTKDKMNRLSSELRRRKGILVPLNFRGQIVDAETNHPIEGAIIFASDRYNKSSHGASDIDGSITITGDYPMLESPPVIVVYKKGYIVQSSWDHGGNSLQRFKWPTGYVFRLKRCDIQSSWKYFELLIGQLDKNSNQLMRDKIEMEKTVK
jgi:hypothetical protein